MRFLLNISFTYKKQKEAKDYVEKTWKVSTNKSLGLQITKWGSSWTLFCVDIIPSWYRSHSGLLIELGLFGYSLIIDFHDNRHWNYYEGRWCKEDEND